MTKIAENAKITLTIGQLKRLVMEAKPSKKDAASVKKAMDFVADKIENVLGIKGFEVGKNCNVKRYFDMNQIWVETPRLNNMKKFHAMLAKTANLVDKDSPMNAYWIAQDKPMRFEDYDCFILKRV